MTTVYDFTVKKPNGSEQSLKDFEGKPLLIVNTASKCGLKDQFKELQEIYDKHKDDDLMILGFPCGQFNNQEFDNIEETTEFCQLNYGVTFPMFGKIDVNGKNEDPLFSYLKSEKGGVLSKEIKWNFTKFLIDRDGNVVERYAPTTKPSKIEKDIMKQL
ncbi:glutathione peroxidase [Aquibacillus kalidii]|uniref:glutathione peroxidase n=1 Tax=Aquibacillus kalidii TaxID=2762597 RepID=UPI001644C54B|nr:glutathione peroxidase [Aquibacillus kalidii]